MSAFLGPIHFWVYNKIQIQQDIVDNILQISGEQEAGLREEADKRYGESETRPLEDVINRTNIHGWLQENVSRVEYKLAFIISRLTEADPGKMEEIRQIFRKKGEELSAQISQNHAAEAYKSISDSLLDGMPCDHANSIVTSDEELAVWKRNSCVHKNYWEEVGVNVDQYYSLREEFIQGCLKDTQLMYEKLDDTTSSIKRRG